MGAVNVLMAITFNPLQKEAKFPPPISFGEKHMFHFQSYAGENAYSNGYHSEFDFGENARSIYNLIPDVAGVPVPSPMSFRKKLIF